MEEEIKEIKTFNKKNLIIFICSIVIFVGLTFAFKLIKLTNIIILKMITQCAIYAIIGGISIFVIIYTKIKTDFEFKNYMQYVYGFGIALVLTFIFGIAPTLFGVNLIGTNTFKIEMFIYNMFFYMVLVGPVEELFFRVYVQEYLISLFKKNKWIAVIITSVMFGFWHLINGSLFQVLFTTIIGAVFGFSKYFIKDIHYPGLALSHGLYNSLIYIAGIFIK